MKRKIDFGNEFKRGDAIIEIIEDVTSFFYIGEIISRNPVSGKEYKYLAFKDGDVIRKLKTDFIAIGEKTLSFPLYKETSYSWHNYE